MVLLTVTPAAKAAIDAFVVLKLNSAHRDEELARLDIGSEIDHHTLASISRHLVQHTGGVAREWRLEALLKGSTVYQPPPPPRPEPTAEYKALMHRLRVQEEQRQYERMIHPPSPETLGAGSPQATTSLGHAVSSAEDIDEVSYADVHRQVVLIINVLVSIICTSVAVWMAARRWSVPQRLGLAFSSSTLVAVAEVVIYMGYLRRIEESKTKERKLVEKKEIVDTWVIDAKTTTEDSAARYRKNQKGKRS